ncbi:nucleotide-binding universal stress UspA family protein [Undibacterium sp. GrIS 1.2]|uniref:universal stress protein n=1 Tax=Undibacterium sp. GrIS 1.2 TaxID=3143933 RepID=UPI003393DB93
MKLRKNKILIAIASTQLLAIIQDYRANMIVVGAFGHSRFREWVFGGVTHDLLLRADCCTFVSH